MERPAQEFLASLTYKSREELLVSRNALLFLINGDVFWPMPKWPKKIRRLLWTKPLGDKECLQLTLFLLGNGCSKNIVEEWIREFGRNGPYKWTT